MKNKITTILQAAIAAVILTFITAGCITTTKPDGSTVLQFDGQRVAAIVRAGLPPIVRLVESKKPEYADIITAIKVGVCALAQSGNVTPADLQATVELAGIKEIQTPEAQAFIEFLYSVYSNGYADAVKAGLSKNEIIVQLIPVLEAICDSI